MKSNIIDIKLKKFAFYLNKIGLLTKEDNPQFLNTFYKLGKNYFNIKEMISSNLSLLDKFFQDNLPKTINLFLNSLTEEKKKIISLNIYKNYISVEKISLNEKGYILYKLYKKLKTKIFFKKWFFLNLNINSKSLSKDKKYSLKETNNNRISYKMSNAQNILGKNNFINVNNSYNYLYNHSSSNDNNISTNHIIENLKNSNINITQNDYYNQNLKHLEKLLDLSQIKSLNKDNEKSYTFTTEYSPYKRRKKEINYELYNKELISGKGSHLFNKKTSLNKKSKSKLNLRLKSHFEYLGNLSKSKKEHKLIPEKTTEYIREQEELKNNCTFKPKINNYKTPKSSLKKIKYDIFITSEKLYLDNQKRMAKKAADTLLRDNIISKENTFKPKLVSSSIKKMKKNFSVRLEEFNKIKQENIKKIMKSIETDNNSIYTFTPKLNNTYNKINYKNIKLNNLDIEKNKIKIPAYQRLYKDNKEKLLRQEERKNQAMEEVLFKANNPLINKTKNNNINKSVDYQKIEELYNDYKKKRIKIKQKQEVIDNEKGITFNPLLINGEKYLDRVEPNFFQREKNFIENQRNHIQVYKNYLSKEKERYFRTNSEDTELIVKNVVERLYKEGLEKYLVRNKTKPNLYSKSYYKTENKEEYDGNETIYNNGSILEMESFGDITKNKNNKKIVFE